MSRLLSTGGFTIRNYIRYLCDSVARMDVASIVLVIVIYLAIGGFISGLLNAKADNMELKVIFFWPMVIVFIVIDLLTRVPEMIGTAVAEFFLGEDQADESDIDDED